MYSDDCSLHLLLGEVLSLTSALILEYLVRIRYPIRGFSVSLESYMAH